MRKEIQDHLWAVLPKEERMEQLRYYRSSECEFDDGVNFLQNKIFGHHNLTSDTEPEEMLIVERQDIINRYKAILVQQDPKNFGFSDYLQGQKELLESMFAAKCIPDKEPSVQSEPMRKVIFKDSYYKEELHGKVGIIRSMNEESECAVAVDNTIYWARESDLEPYTEPETKSMQLSDVKDKIDEYFDTHNEEEVLEDLERYGAIKTKDNMENKELNLAELLKGCEGEKIYSLIDGEVEVFEVYPAEPDNPNFMPYVGAGIDVIHAYHPDGTTTASENFGKYCVCLLYPSRALYEKYPLDAYSAWMEWKSERKPKRWRAEKYQGYYYIDFIGGRLVTLYNTDEREKYENNRYDSYNYFHTKDEANQAAEVVRECLMKFQESVAQTK